jgi:hypothetical protein
MRRVSPWRCQTAHGRRRKAHADQAELAADADIAVGGELLGHLEDALFEFRGRLVGHPGATPRLRRQALGPVLLVGLLDLVEVAPADAGPLAGQPDVVEFPGRGEKPEPDLDRSLVLMRWSAPYVVS